MFTRQDIRQAAQGAVLLLLYMGSDSYRDGMPTHAGAAPRISPLAGSSLRISALTVATAGPARNEGLYHVIVNAVISGHTVEAYCLVTCDDENIILVHPDMYVDGVWLSRRTIPIRKGIPTPYDPPDDYDLAAATQATTFQVVDL